MNVLITGAEYVTALQAQPSDRECRRAFQSLALNLATPGSSVFDFGCGPGIDARHYAEHGLRVVAYDVDADMCAYFSRHCAAAMQTGDIALHTGGYPDFLVSGPLPSWGRVSLITANFAPLNLAPDLRALFARFASLLAPGGRVLASVLNPWYAGDWRQRWWWQNVRHLALRREFAVPGAQGPITRYTAQRLRGLAGDDFTLEAIYGDRALKPGLPRRLPAGISLTCRYLFLQFRLIGLRQ